VAGGQVANLLLATLIERQPELALRSAFGAPRRHTIMDFGTEAAIWSAAAALMTRAVTVAVSGRTGSMSARQQRLPQALVELQIAMATTRWGLRLPPHGVPWRRTGFI